MTREEAIKGLKVLRKDFSGYKPNEEMFDMAIQALEQEPKRCKDCKHFNDGDCEELPKIVSETDFCSFAERKEQ